jgi:hypothetical protein
MRGIFVKLTKLYARRIMLGSMILLGGTIVLQHPSLSASAQIVTLSPEHASKISQLVTNFEAFLQENNELMRRFIDENNNEKYGARVERFKQALDKFNQQIFIPADEFLQEVTLSAPGTPLHQALIVTKEILVESRTKFAQVCTILEKFLRETNVVKFKQEFDPIFKYLESPSTFTFFDVRLAQLAELLEQMELQELATHVKTCRTKMAEEFHNRSSQKASAKLLIVLSRILRNK